jgi:K+-sensing histidine kinase KdpD
MDRWAWTARLREGKALPLALCALVAWVLSLLPWDMAMRIFLPFAFLAVILVIGAYWGRNVGMLASVVSAMVFAWVLYRPVNSMAVDNPQARASLAWMVLAGVSLSFLLLPPGGSRREGR